METKWTSDCGTVTLYCGDCMEILPTLSPGSVDAVVTDPPYGIGFQYESYVDSLDNWKKLIDGIVPQLRAIAKFVVMPCCQVNLLEWWYLNHQPEWIIAWHKGSPGHQSRIGFNCWEPHVTWGRPATAMHDFFSVKCGFDNNGHPCPKPVSWAMWLCARSADAGGCILDSTMGSGTTGVACVRLGRRFIGIELEPKYYEIAKRRIQDELKKVAFLEPKLRVPVQRSLLND